MENIVLRRIRTTANTGARKDEKVEDPMEYRKVEPEELEENLESVA